MPHRPTEPRTDSSLADDVPTAFRTRRAMLRTAGLAAVVGGGAAVLAACSSDGTAGTPSTAPSSDAPSSAAPSAESASPSESESESESPEDSASASESEDTPSGPSVSADDVPQGSGVILEDADYVVTQPSKGSYKAFTATCTHQQCKVSEMRGDRIHCGCHGSEFSIKDGSVVNPPAQNPLKEFKTAVSGGKIFVQE